MISIRSFVPADTNAVVDLWHRCGLVRPTNDPLKDIARKEKVRGDLLMVAVRAEKIIGAIMVGYEGHRGWINYLAVSPEYRKQGCGRKLMDEAERRLRAEGCPKINLQIRSSNTEVLAFYRALGYVQDDVLSFGKRLEHD